MPQRYYKVNNLALSWREIWNVVDTPKSRVALTLLKLLRQPVILSEGVPLPDDSTDWSVASDGLPTWARNRLAPRIAELETLGFHSPQFEVPSESLLANIYGASVALVHESGRCYAMVLAAIGMGQKPPLEDRIVSFLSPFSPGYSVYSTDGRQRFDSPPGHEGIRHPGMSVPELYSRHCQLLDAARGRRTFVNIKTSAEVSRLQKANSQRQREFMVSRGVWVIMTDAEVGALRKKLEKMSVPPIPPDWPA